PYMLVIGQKEVDEDSVSVRDRIEGDIGMIKVDAAIAKLRDEVFAKTIRQTFKSTLNLAGSGSTEDDDY
ncbi:MAG: hypothetical protein JNM18_17385, partial [Planctomycetaceae bacterium]|nr:hypothetical protein [Planctomycetaceae bacterium]